MTPLSDLSVFKQMVGDSPVTYTLVVSERQLHYIRLALREFNANDPGEELDEYGQDIPTGLEGMLADPLVPSPGINGLVI